MKNIASIEFKINMLTPLWSGDIDGASKKLQQTSVVGSLRYIGEALLRGFGFYVCPTVKPNFNRNDKPVNSSSINQCIYKKSDSHTFCIGCYFWGANGWQRQFRIHADGKYTNRYFNVDDNWLKRVFENKYKFLEFKDGINIEFIPLVTFDSLYDEIGISAADYIHLLMDCMQKFGSLGAKSRTGFGFFDIKEGLDEKRVNKAKSILKSIKSDYFRKESMDQYYNKLPNIKKFRRIDFEINASKGNNFVGHISKTIYFSEKLKRYINKINAMNLDEFYRDYLSGWYIKYYIRKMVKSKRRDLIKMLGSTKSGSRFYSSFIYKNNNKYEFRVIFEHEDEKILKDFSDFLIDIFKDYAIAKSTLRYDI